MKIDALKKFRAKLARNEPVYGLWVTVESPAVTEMAVTLGLDWVVIDAEHGHLDWKEIIEHIRASVRSDTVALVRIAERSTSLAKRALDIGADGIVVPFVETVEQLEEALRDCRYPPEGRRGIGGERATVWGQCIADHTADANDHVLVVPLIESVAGASRVADMCHVNGIEVFFFGPADFSASAGFRGEWEGPGVADQIRALKSTIRNAGKHCGVLTTGVDDLLARREDGFRMLALGTDSGLMFRALHQALQVVDCDRRVATSLDPADGRVLRQPLAERPRHIIPDRDAIMVSSSTNKSVTFGAASQFEPFVGEPIQARKLTTGIMTSLFTECFEYHVHPSSESVTVLEGRLEVSIEGRCYQLGPLDNLLIPRWVPHAVRNPDRALAARVHMAWGMSSYEQQEAKRTFSRVEMSAFDEGVVGCERVTRLAGARRQRDIGPGTEFVDYFNAELVPGVEISGGFGRFQPGGRLPQHLHDFDESICIIDGLATCVVEGARHVLSQCATAFVPRGRLHWFVNESDRSMDMIWVYAGPMPERIVVLDRA